MKKIALLFLLVCISYPPAVFAQAGLVGDVDFSAKNFPKLTHPGDPSEVALLVAGVVMKETNFTARIQMFPQGSAVGGRPASLLRSSASRETRLWGVVCVKRSASAYAKEVPFAALYCERGSAGVSMLDIIFNPRAGIDAKNFAGLYREYAKEEIADFEKRYAEDQEAKEKRKQESEERAQKRLDPDFLDTPGYMHSIEGSYDEIKTSLLDVLSEISKGGYRKFDVIERAVSPSSKHAEKNDEGFEGLVLINLEFEPVPNSGMRGERIPYILIKGVKNAQNGFFDICFNPYANEPSQQRVVVALEKKLGIDSLEAKENTSRKLDARNALRKSPDKFDFYDEDLHFEEINGRINFIASALLQTLRDTFPDDKTAKFVVIDGCISNPVRRSSPKEPLESADTDNFEEGFRIVYYNTSNFKSGISAVAVFGESDSDTGKFDLVFNPALKIDTKKFISDFKDAQERLASGRKPRSPFDPPSFDNRNFPRMRVSGHYERVKYSLRQAYSSTRSGSGRLQFNDLTIARRGPAAQIQSEDQDLCYGFTFKDSDEAYAPDRKPIPVVMVRGADTRGDSFEIILHPDAGLDAREFFAILSRLGQNR